MLAAGLFTFYYYYYYYYKAGVISKRKTNMQLRVLSQAKADEAGTSQFNLKTQSNIIKKA